MRNLSDLNKTSKTPNKKPWYKRFKVWAWVLAVLVVMSLFAPDEEVAEEDEVATEVVKPEAVEVAKVKTPEEIAIEAEAVEAKNKADEEAWLAGAKERAKKAEADAVVKAEADAKAKEAAEVKKAKQAEAKVAAEKAEQESLQAIIDLSGGVILSIDPNPYSDAWEVTHVTISDAWYQTPEHEKERFAETVGATVKATIASEVTHVHFFDSYGKKIATEKMFGGYKLN